MQFDPENTDLIVERLEVLQRIQGSLLSQKEVGGAMSALNFLPRIPRSGGVGATVRRRVFNRTVEQNIESLIAAGYVVLDRMKETRHV